jgi:hypothetical protein
MPEYNKRIEISVRVERSIGGKRNLTQRRKDAKATANGHELTRKDTRRGVAFRMLARTHLDALNSL